MSFFMFSLLCLIVIAGLVGLVLVSEALNTALRPKWLLFQKKFHERQQSLSSPKWLRNIIIPGSYEDHKWHGCRCRVCKYERDGNHVWNKDETCSICGKKAIRTICYYCRGDGSVTRRTAWGPERNWEQGPVEEAISNFDYSKIEVTERCFVCGGSGVERS